MNTLPCTSRSGMALVMAVGIITILLALATSLTNLTVSNLTESVYRREQTALYVGTESLANLGFSYLQQRSDLADLLNTARGTGTQPLLYTYNSDGSVEIVNQGLVDAATLKFGTMQAFNGLETDLAWTYVASTAVEMNGASTTQDLYRLSATGGIGGPARLYVADVQRPIADINHYRRKRVEVLFTTSTSFSYAFRQAMWAKKGFSYMGSAKTDSWNSNGGSVGYAAAAKGAQGDLSSNGGIEVQKAENVKGSANSYVNMVLPNVSYNLSGTETPLPGPLGVLSSAANLASGTYRCSALDITAKNPITFQAGATVTIYVDTYVKIKNDWDLTLCGNPTKVVLIQNNYDSSLGSTTINGNITVGNKNNPAAFQFYSLYDGKLPDSSNPQPFDFKMNGTATFGGVILAPEATFALNGTFNFYGSLLADSFKDATDAGKVNGSFEFHYDESLGNVLTPFPSNPTLIVVGWNTLDIPPHLWRNELAGIRWDDP